MRTLKFKCWDKQEKRWDDFLHLPTNCESEGERFVWVQFTGLLDKSGKEIYEGDIAKITQKPFTNDFEQTEIGVMRYVENEARFAFSLNDSLFLSGQQQGQIVRVEIIGNIYENPELLK